MSIYAYMAKLVVASRRWSGLGQIMIALSLCFSFDAVAGLQEGLNAYKVGNYPTALKELRPYADNGDAEAQFDLGNIYRKGNGVAQDDEQAVEWYQKAAAQGHAKAQDNLGVMYSTGRGVARDPKSAAVWIRKAAEQGLALAQFQLSELYLEGKGVQRDETIGLQWLRKAAGQGLAVAQSNLGATYQDGRGVPKSSINAISWLKKAAAQGYAPAESNLGLIYYRGGNGVLADYNEALSWFKLAAKQSEPVALNALENDHAYKELAAHFRNGCPASLSEQVFRTYFNAVGAKVGDVNKPDQPFSIVAAMEKKGIMAVHYRKPLKCCLSVFVNIDDSNHNDFVTAMMHYLPLRNPKAIKVGQRAAMVFQPNYSNRMLSVDWDKSKGRREISNLCQSDFPNAGAAYLDTRKLF